jgi:hypothetical protein
MARKDIYGKYTEEITAIIERVKKFTLDDFKKCSYAYAAAYAAYDAAAAADAYAAYAADAYAAYGYYWPTRRVAWRAIVAILARDSIGKNFTQEQYNLLMKPWNDFINESTEEPQEEQSKGVHDLS